MRLKEYINTLDISPNDFAKKIGMSHMTIRSLMAGKRDVYLTTALKIEKGTLGVVTCQELLPEKFKL